MNILAVSGSPRKGGNTSRIMKRIAAGAEKAGAAVTCVELCDYSIHGCIGCERCRKDRTCTRFLDGMHLLYQTIEYADGLVLGSPTYNYNMTHLMKIFIDRLYPYYNFTEQRPGPYSSRLGNQGKKALVFGICEQNDPKEAGYNVVSMADALEALGYEVTGREVFTSLFAYGAASKDDASLKRAEELGKHFCIKAR